MNAFLEMLDSPAGQADSLNADSRPSGGFAASDEGEGHDFFSTGIVSTEGISVQYGLVPFDPDRLTCSVEAETLVRSLGRIPVSETPWLPYSTLGPFLIFVHHEPKSEDTWGVPSCFGIRAVISPQQYEEIRRDLVKRISHSPLPASNPLEQLTQPEFPTGELSDAFDWLLAHYPFGEKERESLEASLEKALEKETDAALTADDFNGFMPGLGVALKFLIEGTSLLCFNPAEAPKQDRFPEHLLEKYCVYPLYVGTQRVYLLNPDGNILTFEDEWLSLGNEAITFVSVEADRREIRQVINRRDSMLDGSVRVDFSEDSLTFGQGENIVELVPEDVLRVNPENVNHSPEELMHWVIYHSVNARASDIHVEQFHNVARFRARIDGNLKTIFTAPHEVLPRFIAILKNWANMTQTRQNAQDARFTIMIGRRRIDVRVAAVPCRGGLQKIVMRLLDKQDGLKELVDLDLSRHQTGVVKRVMSRDQGLVLVTGPTGSGKTTTLYALINSVNEEDINIHTIEDPIEYEIEGISQTQTDPVHGLTFATGLRALLRSDPDVILIGECRDEETANAAVNSALTGHLVLTTLHANDSLRAVSRLLSMEVDPHLVADSLALTQAQRLVRHLCNYCKRPIEAARETQEMMHRQGVIAEPLKVPLYMAVGCPECHGTGYSGRLALMELLEVNTEIADMVEREAPQTELRVAALKTGFRSLYQEGIVQVISGNTTLDEIKKVSYTAV